MRRREVIKAILGSVSAWPLVALAQQSDIPVIGLISTGSSADVAHLVAAFRRGLNETGFIEGQNVLIEYRWAEINTIEPQRSRPISLIVRCR